MSSESCIFVESRELHLLAGTVTFGSRGVKVRSRVASSFFVASRELRLLAGSVVIEGVGHEKKLRQFSICCETVVASSHVSHVHRICCSAAVVGHSERQGRWPAGVGWCTRGGEMFLTRPTS